MHGEGFFYQAFIYLLAAVVSVPIAKRLGLGSVLGYLIAGVAIGPFGFGLVGEEGQDVMHFAEFGVVMMLFLVGLELEPSLLWRMRGPIVGLGGLQVGITTVILSALAYGLGLEWNVAIAVGMTLALSSTAIALQTMNEKGLMKTAVGQNGFAILLFQDLAVLPMLALMPLLAPRHASDGGESAAAGATAAGHGAEGAGHGAGHGAEHATTWVEGLPAWGQTLMVLTAIAAIILGGRYIVRPAFRLIAKTRLPELFTAGSLLLVIGIALLMTKVGLSPALGTFLAGVVLATSEFRHELETDIEPFKGLLLGVFFIAVGASIDFALVGERPGRIAFWVAALMILKFIVLFGLARAFKICFDQSMTLSFLLAQGGEFAFVLFSFAVQNNVVGADVANPMIAVVALTMLLTPLLLILNEKLIQPRFGTREVVEREADEIDVENSVIIAGFGRFGSVVGRFLTANGVGTTVLDNDADRVDLLRSLGLKVFYGDATRHDLLHTAGAAEAKLLVLALDSPEMNRDLVDTVRKHFPHLKILSRATSLLNTYELIDAKVDYVYRETLDSSLALGVDALRELGFRAHQAHRAARKFRCHDEHAIHELSQMRHDRKQYMNLARERIQNLEEIMRSDLEDVEEDRDAGWDTESLRRDFGSERAVGE